MVSGKLCYYQWAPHFIMSNPFELSLSDSFNKERFSRAIDESTDVKELRDIAKVLLGGWLTQKAATQWILKEALGKSATVSTEAFGFTIPAIEQ
jgi:hypothetical protein